jgi:hypothetical protein
MRRLPSLCLALALLPLACGDNQTHPPDYAPYDAGIAQPFACIPNLDGKIEASELPVALGVPVSFLVSPTGAARPFDRDGVVGTDGKRRWAWDDVAADDRVLAVSASGTDGAWYADSFPNAQFVLPSDSAGRTVAIYEHTDEAVNLLGFASAEEAPAEGKTLIVYSDPVAVSKFPLTLGATWTSTSAVRNALFRGLPYAADDTYEISVDASGEMTVPDLTFSQVLRVRTTVTTAPVVGPKIVTRQLQYFFECFGEVARATAAVNEPNADFLEAAEVRRIGLAPTLR